MEILLRRIVDEQTASGTLPPGELAWYEPKKKAISLCSQRDGAVDEHLHELMRARELRRLNRLALIRRRTVSADTHVTVFLNC